MRVIACKLSRLRGQWSKTVGYSHWKVGYFITDWQPTHSKSYQPVNYSSNSHVLLTTKQISETDVRCLDPH